eukprot:scaffold78690_cov21-Tisochrysis_lutea.AAC.1
MARWRKRLLPFWPHKPLRGGGEGRLDDSRVSSELPLQTQVVLFAMGSPLIHHVCSALLIQSERNTCHWVIFIGFSYRHDGLQAPLCCPAAAAAAL